MFKKYVSFIDAVVKYCQVIGLWHFKTETLFTLLRPIFTVARDLELFQNWQGKPAGIRGSFAICQLYGKCMKVTLTLCIIMLLCNHVIDIVMALNYSSPGSSCSTTHRNLQQSLKGHWVWTSKFKLSSLLPKNINCSLNPAAHFCTLLYNGWTRAIEVMCRLRYACYCMGPGHEWFK